MGSTQSCSFYDGDKLVAIVISRLSLPKDYAFDPLKSTTEMACYVHKYDDDKPAIWYGRNYYVSNYNSHGYYYQYTYQEAVNIIRNKYKDCKYKLDDYKKWKDSQSENLLTRVKEAVEFEDQRNIKINKEMWPRY